MSTYQHNCNSDYRNEGWTLHGGSSIWGCWTSGDDNDYCSNPSNKGRAACTFPVDISSDDIPSGSEIESVTIFLRAKKTDSGSRSVTVNVLCKDNTAHFTQRTVYLSENITTAEIATYTKDPLGKPWTKDRLNRLIVQVFSYCGASDRVRVYSCYAVINYRNRPVVKVTAPSGSVDSAAPAIGWTYTQVDGDPQAFAEYKIYTAAQQEVVGFNPNTTPALYPASSTYTVKSGDSLYKIAADKLGDGNLWPEIYQASTLRSGNPDLIYPGEIVTIPGIASVQGDITALTALPFALAQDDYYIYVRATSTHHARSEWANRTFTVTGGVPGVPGGGTGGTLGGIGSGGGGGFESVIADSTTSNAYLTLRDGSNMLGAHMSDFESLTDSLGYTAVNATLSQDTTTNYGVGGASMKMVASAAGDMSAVSDYIQISQGAPVTVSAQFKSALTARTCDLSLNFYDSSYTAVTGSVTGSITDSADTWTEVTATGTTPTATGVMYFQVVAEVESAAASEVHNVDHVGVMYGTDSVWSNGGHNSRNLLTGAQSTADEPIDTEPWVAAAASTYSRVTTSGTGSEGAKTFKMQYVGSSPTISYVATGTAFTDSTSGTGFTLNKPSGVVDGDLLVAYVASSAGGPVLTVDGWTQVDYVEAGSDHPSSLTILMRDGLAADPSSWTGNFSASTTRKRASVVAYRGTASVASQFPQENVSSSTGGSATVATAAVTNPNAGAWRLSAFVANDDTSGGSFTANTTPPSVNPPIAYVGRASVYKENNDTTHYRINRPSNIRSGDLMIAALGVSGNVTVTPPTGWTVVRHVHQTQGNGDDYSGSNTLCVMKRTAGSSEPTSWSSTHTSEGAPKVVQCVAYRNAALDDDQFIDEDGSSRRAANITTATVSNDDSKAWRVCIFNSLSDDGTSISSNEVSERCDDTTSNQQPAPAVSVCDSNGSVSTGNHSRNASSTRDWDIYNMTSWIGLIKPLSGSTDPGANETERQDATVGSSVTLAVYDSNAVAATGSTTVYGSFSNNSPVSTCSWLGFLAPAAATTAGEVGAIMADYVDISAVSADVFNRAGNQMSVNCSFLGSTAGTPHLTLYSYVGNELLSTQIAEGASFATDVWQASSASFVLPQGTTRLKLGVTAADREVSDYVLFDKVMIAFGSDAVWRPGTGRDAHPVFNVPVIEYSEDLGLGYDDWRELPGTSSSLLKYDNLSGLCTFIDQTIVPLSMRKYRAKTVSYGLAGDIFTSDFGPESEEVQLIADEWWLKDLSVPEQSMKLKVKADPLKVGTADTSAVFQPLGADKPIVVTEGYKGDVIQVVLIVDRFEYAQLRDLFNARRTLFLQSNMDNSWWVRPNGDISAETQLTGQRSSNPLRFVTVSFVEVDPQQ